MKVLLVSNGFPPSGQWGTEFYTHQLATGLVARGHDVAVLFPRRDGARPRYEVTRTERYGVRLVEVHNAGDPRKRFADSYENRRIEALFDDLLDELEPDVVHFAHFLWGLSVHLPERARARGAGVVATLTDLGLLCHRGQLFDARQRACPGPEPARCAACVREPGPYDDQPLVRALRRAAGETLAALGGLGLAVTARDFERRAATVRAALGAIDRVVAPTETLARRFRGAWVDPRRLSVLCYGIDEEPYRAAPARAADGVFRFGFIGQFQPHKGLRELFAALRELAPLTSRPWELRVHGNVVGGRHKHYLQRIWDPALARRVDFAGPFAPLDGPQVMSRLDALVVPSQWTENAPLIVLQARAMGLPLIASDVPGIREVADEGRGVRLVARDDPAAFGRAMAATLDEDAGRDPRAAVPLRFTEHLRRMERHYAAAREAAAAVLA